MPIKNDNDKTASNQTKKDDNDPQRLTVYSIHEEEDKNRQKTMMSTKSKMIPFQSLFQEQVLFRGFPTRKIFV